MRTEATPDVVHRYLSELTNSAEWNPRVTSCHRRPTTQGHTAATGVDGAHEQAPQVGDRYLSVQQILGRRTVLHHELVEHVHPRLAAWTASSRHIRVLTTIDLIAHGRGTELAYSTTFTVRHAPRVSQRVLHTLVQRDLPPTRHGLTRALARLASA